METIRHIPLSKGKFAVVDAHNYEWLMQWKWQAGSADGKLFYAVRNQKIDGHITNIPMHRLILEKKLGRKLMPVELTDHENRDGLCNLEENLRVATPTQNAGNKGKAQRRQGTYSKYKGVTKNDRGVRYWQAAIRFEGRTFFLGNYATQEAAARAYDAAAVYFYKEFAYTNFEGAEPKPVAQIRLECLNGLSATERSRGASQYLGVVKSNRSKPWKCLIRSNGKNVYFGSYATQESAAKAYDSAARYYHGLDAVTNFEGDEAMSVEDLSEVSRRDNALEKPRSSKYIGVATRYGKWVAFAKANGKTCHIGYFETEEAAARARDKFAREKLGPRALLNFPEG